MTRKEKEKILLEGLGLKAGDMIEGLGPVAYKDCRFYTIVEENSRYTLVSVLDESIFEVSILIYWDFKKVKPKKRNGDVLCDDIHLCKYCPLNTIHCRIPNKKDPTLYEVFEETNIYYPMLDKIYEAYKEILDTDVEEEFIVRK